jgi:hypothetical protein
VEYEDFGKQRNGGGGREKDLDLPSYPTKFNEIYSKL